MIKPIFCPNVERKIVSLFQANIALNAGALVDMDPADTSAITASIGYGTLKAGSLKLATPPALTATTAVQVFTRELGFSLPAVNSTGPQLIERILRLASSYMTIPTGLNAAVLVPSAGDIIATTEYVGYLAGDSAATGKIDLTLTANLGAAVEIFQGRYRLCQAGNPCRARILGNTTANGAALGVFQIL